MDISKRYKIFVVLIVCLFLGCNSQLSSPIPASTQTQYRDDAQKIYSAYQNHQSNFFVESKGRVVKILLDDLKGSRHQRFILQLAKGQTILVAHNIDIAPRINNLNIGDEVYFYGEYEWNDKGGVVHWTHHDPGYRRIGGWLEHQGMRYQ
ncbi:MAG: DUF3465 domain-containing protein [Candidatus Omnitrophica bacterium]|nr:DUF3465 domain-containing protein [Candidatus Omnitrophota bacterium]